MSKFNVPSNEEHRNELVREEISFRHYDPEPQRDYMRAGIASGLLVLLMGMVAYGFYTAHGDYDRTKELLEKLLPAVIGLLGSAIGFYFGSKNGKA
jgi:hypothetical protein